MNTNNLIFLVCTLSITLLLHPRVTIAQGSGRYNNEVANQTNFDYKLYSPIGPDNWAKRPGWEKCNSARVGSMQSPIDLSNSRVMVRPNLGELVMNYSPAKASLENRGKDIMLKWEGNAGTITIGGTNYKLVQCHWHSSSEHTLDGRRYALEIHLVHETTNSSSAKKIAVVELLYKLGAPDPFLKELDTYIGYITNQKLEVPIAGTVDPNHINIGCGEYYRYLGSLTTPPCTENIIWTISKRVRTASQEQVAQLRKAFEFVTSASLQSYKSNSRPLQPLNNRPVQLHNGKPFVTPSN